MSAFEDFVNIELPKRPVMLTLANTAYDNDPNGGGAPAVVANSPQGTYFFRTTGNILYVKNTSAPGSWALVGSGGSSNAVTHTIAPLTYYVSSTGLDTNDGSISLPFLTIQKAIDVLPKTLRHLATINVGAGNFAGFRVEGFTVAGLVANDFAGFSMLGTYGTFVPTTGTGTGTATSTVTGTSSPVVFTVLNDTTQTWTVDNLRGQYLYVTSGTGIGGMFPIINNTATSLTVQSTAAIGATSTYVIRELLTIITSSVRAEPIIPTSTQITVNTGILAAAHFQNNQSPRLTATFRVEGIKFASVTPSTLFGINSQSMNNFAIARCTLINAQSGFSSLVNASGIGTVLLQNCYVNCSISGNAIQPANNCSLNVTNCLVVGTSATVSLSVRTVNNLFVFQTTIDGGAFGVDCQPLAPSSMNFTTNRIGNTSSQAFRIRNAASSCDLTISDLDIGGFGGNGNSTAVEIFGFHSCTITGLVVQKYLVGLTAAFGAQVQINAASTIIGAGLDVIVSNIGLAISLGIMRAAPGKIVTGPDGTIIRE